jgi:predicted glycoside hydrolase/deacetylase ChbG (UPF0249 family)
MAASELNRQLIITADDCGLSEGINAATCDLHRMGLVTTATVMMNFASAPHALESFTVFPSLNVGVHLNLTDGYPLTDIDPATGLTHNDGRFQSRTSLFPRAMFPTDAWLSAATFEMQAQIESFIAQTGYRPDHLTTHMHFHILPSLREAIFGLADQYGIEWVRAFHTNSTVIPFNFLVQEPAELFRPDNLKITPDYIASIQAWLNQEPERLVETIMGLNGLIEIVVHPDSLEDATYPNHMNHKPEARAREMDYLLRLGDALQPYIGNFQIADPATHLAS